MSKINKKNVTVLNNLCEFAKIKCVEWNIWFYYLLKLLY